MANTKENYYSNLGSERVRGSCTIGVCFRIKKFLKSVQWVTVTLSLSH